MNRVNSSFASSRPVAGVYSRKSRQVVQALPGNGQQTGSPASTNDGRTKSVLKTIGGVAIGSLASLALTGGAWAVTTEQLLFLDGWRAVDRAYVDKTFNGVWFMI